MSVECYLDNCPHHEAKHSPIEIGGPFCHLERCAWDEPTMSAYLTLVNNGNKNAEAILPTDGEQPCNNSQEENT